MALPVDLVTDHGPAAWASPEWRQEAVRWLDTQLAAAGIERRGDVEQPHLRPWATVLRVPTSAGTVWMKAAGPGTAFEVGLYELLARVVPARVLTPIAADPVRGWIVLPDGGPSLGERGVAGSNLADALVTALVRYGELQRELAPHVEELLALGVADMRPGRMLAHFDEAVAATGQHDMATMRQTVAAWCDQLEASSLLPSLDHNDLHPWNILGDGPGTRFYDWGDSVVAHPFAAMLVPLGFVQRGLEVGLEDASFRRARDAYLDGFTDMAPGEDLASTLDVACRVAKVARTLTWDRAVAAARDAGEGVDDDFATAPQETLASLLDDSYLGGA